MSKKLEAIAATMGECYDSRNSFIADFAYHPGHTGTDRIFTNGSRYFAIGKRAPKTECGPSWEKHPDQFWAEKLELTVWVCG